MSAKINKVKLLTYWMEEKEKNVKSLIYCCCCEKEHVFIYNNNNKNFVCFSSVFIGLTISSALNMNYTLILIEPLIFKIFIV